jgi:hypothetical protein
MKVRIVLRPCRLFDDDEVPKSQRGNSNTAMRIPRTRRRRSCGRERGILRRPLGKEEGDATRLRGRRASTLQQRRLGVKKAPPSDSSEPAKSRVSLVTATAPNASPSRRMEGRYGNGMNRFFYVVIG